MRRWIVATLVFGLVLSALGAEAGAQGKNKKKPKGSERVVEARYDGPVFGSPSSPGRLCYAPVTCPLIATSTKERFVRIAIEDASGTATAFFLGQETGDSTDVETDYGIFCGSTGTKPIRLETPGAPLVVGPYLSGDVVCPGALGTTGMVRAILTIVP